MMQNRPKIIIITGSIATGKSTVVNIIKSMEFQVLDADKIVHEGYAIGKELYKDVLNYFGQDILNEDKTINRQKLGNVVFNDNEKLNKLNSIVHASVYEDIRKGVEDCKDKVIFLDIPLALENIDCYKRESFQYDEIWLVYVSPKLQRERLKLRALQENKPPKDVLKIIDKQISIDEKLKMVDEVINNEGTLEELEEEIKKLLIRKNLI